MNLRIVDPNFFERLRLQGKRGEDKLPLQISFRPLRRHRYPRFPAKHSLNQLAVGHPVGGDRPLEKLQSGQVAAEGGRDQGESRNQNGEGEQNLNQGETRGKM